jgi:hypothetical protein
MRRGIETPRATPILTKPSEEGGVKPLAVLVEEITLKFVLPKEEGLLFKLL